MLLPKYILGIKGISQFFGLGLGETLHLIKNGGIPGVFKQKRKAEGGFQGGGRGVWAINRRLAEQYRHTRLKTPLYDPHRATNAPLNKFQGTGCGNIPQLIKNGHITDLDWCAELDKWRAQSNMHIPILMHPDNLKEYFADGVDKVTTDMLYSETAAIFKAIRKRG